MCCVRKKSKANPIEEIKRNYDMELQITNFHELTESFPANSIGSQEMIDKKNLLMAMPEWKNPNKSNLNKLKDQSGTLMRSMITQISDMSRGLKTLILINKQLEESISVNKESIKK